MTLYSTPSTTPAALGQGSLGDGSGEITLTDIIRVLSAHRRLLAGLPLVLGFLFALWAYSRPLTYTATAAFAAQGGSAGGGGLAGLAGQLGIGAVSGGTESPAYYTEVIRSSAVLGAIAAQSVEHEGRLLPLSLVLGIVDTDSVRRRSLASETLRDMIVAQTSRETGIVRVEVTARQPNIAVQTASLLLRELNEFNLKQRQLQASREREFAERQLAAARAEADAAQGQLARFIERNRQYQNAPVLLVEHERLQRAVTERQQVVSSLITVSDQARLDEARNTPRIIVLESATPPLRPNARGTISKGIAGAFLGFVLAVGFAFLREYYRASTLSAPTARP